MLSDRVLEALRSVVPGPASLHEPMLDGNEARYVRECVESGIVSSIGPYVDRLEAVLAARHGVKHAVLTVNGTAALHMCLHLAGVRRDEEVLVPALSFVATANAVAHCGAIPHFLEHERATLGVSPAALEDHLDSIAERRADGTTWNRGTGRRLAACVPMHTFGHPVDMRPLLAVCRRFGIPVVEDAAESLGSEYHGRPAGSFGKLAALSFNGNKIVTTGGGGAILTDDGETAALAKHLTTTAKQPHKWAYVHDQVAWNYRMPNLNAALGCAQLERLDEFLARKRALAGRYRSAFAGLPGVAFFEEPAGCRSNYWLNTLVFAPEALGEREATLEKTHAAGLLTRPAWALLNRLPMYRDCPSMALPVAEELEAGILNIPSGAGLQPA
jgi:perosamine synthetase